MCPCILIRNLISCFFLKCLCWIGIFYRMSLNSCLHRGTRVSWPLIPASEWLISVAQLADEWAGHLVSFIRAILSSPFSSWSGSSNLPLFSPPPDSAEDTLCPCFTPPSCCAACRTLPFNSHLYSHPLRLCLPRRSVCWHLFKGVFNSFVRSLSLLNMIHHPWLPSTSPSFSFIPLLLFFLFLFLHLENSPCFSHMFSEVSKRHFLNITHFLGLQLGISVPAIEKKPSTQCSANESQPILSPSVCGCYSRYLHSADTNTQHKASISSTVACSLHLFPLEYIRAIES